MIHKTRISEEERHLIFRLYVDEGLTCGNIGKKIGRSSATVHSALHAMGVRLRKSPSQKFVTENPVRKYHWSAAELNLLKWLRSEGRSYKECARIMGRTVTSIEKTIMRHKLQLPTEPVVVEHSPRGNAIGEFWNNMKRETDKQAAMWRKLLAEARA